jgi:hypothetical protein
MTHRELAERIAEALFTDGQGEKADRLQLRFGGPPVERERPGGGWGFGPAIDQIEKVLKDTKVDE